MCGQIAEFLHVAVCTIYSVHYSQCALFTVCTVYSVHCSQCALFTVYTIHNVHCS